MLYGREEKCLTILNPSGYIPRFDSRTYRTPVRHKVREATEMNEERQDIAIRCLEEGYND